MFEGAKYSSRRIVTNFIRSERNNGTSTALKRRRRIRMVAASATEITRSLKTNRDRNGVKSKRIRTIQMCWRARKSG